jgi:hypothetical protein
VLDEVLETPLCGVVSLLPLIVYLSFSQKNFLYKENPNLLPLLPLLSLLPTHTDIMGYVHQGQVIALRDVEVDPGRIGVDGLIFGTVEDGIVHRQHRGDCQYLIISC